MTKFFTNLINSTDKKLKVILKTSEDQEFKFSHQISKVIEVKNLDKPDLIKFFELEMEENNKLHLVKHINLQEHEIF